MSFADKRLTFGGAGPGTPWGTLGEITARVLAPLGYQVRVEPEASRGRCPGLVSAGKLEFPAWLAVAARWETGLTDLAQVAERRLPVRILGGTGDLFGPILAHYGLSRELIESWGGKFLP